MELSRPITVSLPVAPAAERPATKAPSDTAHTEVDRTAGDRAVPSPAASLWDALTPDEREVFERSASMGPLVYRPDGQPAAEMTVPTGRRVDLRG